jgi:hypothetical protein
MLKEVLYLQRYMISQIVRPDHFCSMSQREAPQICSQHPDIRGFESYNETHCSCLRYDIQSRRNPS